MAEEEVATKAPESDVREAGAVDSVSAQPSPVLGDHCVSERPPREHPRYPCMLEIEDWC